MPPCGACFRSDAERKQGVLSMDNFNFYSPTYFAFGKDREQDAGALVKRFGGSKVSCR